jgi:hypothetical protein
MRGSKKLNKWSRIYRRMRRGWKKRGGGGGGGGLKILKKKAEKCIGGM